MQINRDAFNWSPKDLCTIYQRTTFYKPCFKSYRIFSLLFLQQPEVQFGQKNVSYLVIALLYRFILSSPQAPRI